ncbi:MAG: glycosyl transferase GT4 family protein, partial [Methanobrevibacter sp.]|nr:glycosyl transferase GT4 family protein [Methanobrevibacter sp.]
MKKVILIAFYFNQVNEIASKRLRALAKYLPQFGWEPIVIVPDLGFIPKENDDLNCRIIYTEYEDMFGHFSNKFKKSKSVDSNDSNDSKDSKDSKDPVEFNDEKLKDSTSFSNPIVSKAISMAGEVFAYPDGMKYWHESALKEASKIMDDEEIDAIISSSWPITCHTIAKDLKEKHDVPWIADLRDLWNLNPYVSHTFIRNYFEKRLELKTFENADALSTTTDLAAKTLSTLHPDNRIVPILSGYDKDDFKFLDELVSERDDFSTGLS